MFVRVVRFADVSAERMDGLEARIDEPDGPPPGVNATELKVLFDADQGTAVVLQFFATAEDMAAAEAVFDAMDASDTPGTRTSVDRCAIKLERSMPATSMSRAVRSSSVRAASPSTPAECRSSEIRWVLSSVGAR